MVVARRQRGRCPSTRPADPSSSDYPARPEWFFLSLFQMLKHFPGKLEWSARSSSPRRSCWSCFLLPLLDRVLPVAARPFPGLHLGLRPGRRGGLPDRRGAPGRRDATSSSWRPARRPTRPASGRSSWPPAPRRASRPKGPAFLMRRDPLTTGAASWSKKCLGCHVLRGQGRRASRRPCDLKDFGSRAWIRGLLENPQAAGLLRQGPPVRRHGRVEEELEAQGQGARRRGRLRGLVRQDPRRHDPGRVAEQPRGGRASRQEPFEKECGQCHMIEGYTEGGTRDAPEPLRLGLAPVDRPDDPQAGRPGPLRLPRGQGPDAPLRADQLTDNDVDMVIRYLQNDYPMPDRPAATSARSRVASRERRAGERSLTRHRRGGDVASLRGTRSATDSPLGRSPARHSAHECGVPGRQDRRGPRDRLGHRLASVRTVEIRESGPWLPVRRQSKNPRKTARTRDFLEIGTRVG